MARAKSIRPKKPTDTQQLDVVIRSLGRPADGLLAAALEGVSPESVMTEAQAPDAMQLLLDGARIILDAHRAWKAITLEQRIRLGGFSMNLLGLAAAQFAELEQLESSYLAFIRAQDEAQGEVRRVFQRNVNVVDQARRLLAKVARHDEEVRDELEASNQPETTFELAQSVERLVILGGKLLRSNDMAQLSRASLYGLDDRYLDALGNAGAQLMVAEESVPSSNTSHAKKLDLERQRGVVVWLLRQIVDAFDGAHRVEDKIPLVYAPLPMPSGPPTKTLQIRLGPKVSGTAQLAHTAAYVAPAPPPKQKATQAIVRAKPAPTEVLPLKIQRVPK